MIQKTTLKFLKDLKKNNNKSWFDEHRASFEFAKADIRLLVDQLIAAIAVFDSPIGNLIAKECVFRINRDIRFSKDKRPYKNNMACYFNKGGKKGNGAGYYLHIEPGKSFAAGGIWMPPAPDLAKMRQEIDYSFDEWKKVMGSSSFTKQFPGGVTSGEALTRPPKGYEETNPAIHFIKMKNFIVSRPFSDTEIQNKSFVRDVAATFRAMKPMIDFLNKAIA
jgi:uncharacterized protein (TIGR02453 family)